MKRAADLASKLPTNIFQTGVANYSAAYWGSGDPRFANCSMKWFLTWARANALTGTCNFEGHVTRQLLFSGIVHSYLRIQMEPSLALADRAVVEAWIARVGGIVMAEYSSTGPYGGSASSARSNLMYMAGD